ncbi:cytochrome D1 domain-containing protein [Gemmobacter denitrificans]|uniref:Cytochrome D1 domain-containing protein n=1 Tax=Gemmobacter denitrificans TaxID=3123040 RepID=A0ABU8BVM1_9RHOB
MARKFYFCSPLLSGGITLSPKPDGTVAHAEFTHDGCRALFSISEMDGAVIVYDTATQTGLHRLPMVKPAGKNNY